MSAPRRRRFWLRRLGFSLAVLVGTLALAIVAAWLSLPWLVREGFHAGSRSLESDEASIEITRADLSGLHAKSLRWRLGGLAFALDDGTVSYSIGTLLDGRVTEVTVEGLAVTLDFTRPRRGMLPDAITDLVARFSSDDPLVWPVDKLSLENCRLILALPEGAQTVLVSGWARRRADGFIQLELQASDPEQHLAIRGSIRTETLDGELTVDRLTLQPGTLLGIARQLGAFTLPDGLVVDVSGIELSSTATLTAGIPTTYTARLQIPSARVAQGPTQVRIEELALETRQATDNTRAGSLTATILASDTEAGWVLQPAALAATLAEGTLRGHLAPAVVSAGATIGARIAMAFEAGLPPLGGKPHASTNITITDLRAAGQDFAPIELTLQGWTDRLTLGCPRVALAAESPLELAQMTGTVVDPFGPGRSAAASVEFVAGPALLALLPAGWTMPEPVMPAPLAKLELKLTTRDGAPGAALALRSTVARVHFAHDARSLACAPALDLRALADGAGASLDAELKLQQIEATPALPGSMAKEASLRIEMPTTSYATLAALAAGRAAEGPLSITLRTALGTEAQGVRASLILSHEPDAGGWRATVDAALGGLTGRVFGTDLKETTGAFSLDSGIVPDSVAAAWLRSKDTDAASAIVRALAPQVALQLSANASAIDVPDTARLEWAALTLEKSAAREGEPPLRASLRAHTGILRAGPETIEQPALAIDLSGDLATQSVVAKLSALLEGAPLVLETTQALTLDPTSLAVGATGVFSLQPFALANSDIASRWAPDLKGLVTSGTIAVEGTTRLAGDGSWDGTARLRLSEGVVNYPAQDVRVDGVFADVAFESLADLRTAPGQRVGFSRLTVNDIVATEALVHFRTASSTVVHVEGAGFHVFDGVITAEPFSLYFPDADVALDLRMKDLDAGELVRTFDLFNGSLTGRLQGRLPIGLLAGKPIIGEGFLELQPEHPATFSLDAGGLFTSGLPNRTALEKVNRLPQELLEDGLANLRLKHFRVDLFRRDQPDRPIAIQLGGVARTARADVPIELTVNLHGSMSEVIDMLLQLIML